MPVCHLAKFVVQGVGVSLVLYTVSIVSQEPIYQILQHLLISTTIQQNVLCALKGNTVTADGNTVGNVKAGDICSLLITQTIMREPVSAKFATAENGAPLVLLFAKTARLENI